MIDIQKHHLTGRNNDKSWTQFDFALNSDMAPFFKT